MKKIIVTVLASLVMSTAAWSHDRATTPTEDLSYQEQMAILSQFFYTQANADMLLSLSWQNLYTWSKNSAYLDKATEMITSANNYNAAGDYYFNSMNLTLIKGAKTKIVQNDALLEILAEMQKILEGENLSLPGDASEE
jgi:hypothetical protein